MVVESGRDRGGGGGGIMVGDLEEGNLGLRIIISIFRRVNTLDSIPSYRQLDYSEGILFYTRNIHYILFSNKI